MMAVFTLYQFVNFLCFGTIAMRLSLHEMVFRATSDATPNAASCASPMPLLLPIF